MAEGRRSDGGGDCAAGGDAGGESDFNRSAYDELITSLQPCMHLEILKQPIIAIDDTEGYRSLYVGQDEYCVVKHDDENIDFIGTEYLTTCLALILRCRETGHVAFGHFSQTTVGSGECIADMFESFFKFDVPSTASTRIFDAEVYGGLDDNMSQRMTFFLIKTLKYLQNLHDLNLNFRNIVVSEFNTNELNMPIISSIGINLKSGEVKRCKFKSQIPDFILRQTRLYCTLHSEQMDKIYDSLTHELTFGPYIWYDEDVLLSYFSKLLLLDDQNYLKETSTSPLQEDAEFCERSRNVIRFMTSSYLTNWPARRYRRHKVLSTWIRIE